MCFRKVGLAAALLFVFCFQTGCSGNDSVRQNGLVREFVSTECMEPESGQTTGMETETPAIIETQTETEGYVYVCGAVVRPGVYPVTAGMRLFEVISLAGGFLETADEEWLNQAAEVSDGQRIYVYTCEETGELSAHGVSPDDPGSEGNKDSIGHLVNLNTASKEELMTLPGVGESKADAIIQYRTECGGFESCEDIMQISGIKEAVFSKIKEYITVQ